MKPFGDEQLEHESERAACHHRLRAALIRVTSRHKTPAVALNSEPSTNATSPNCSADASSNEAGSDA